MNYNAQRHITTDQLAALMGVSIMKLAGGIRKYGGPKALGRASVGGRQQSIYCRRESLAWIESHWPEKVQAEQPAKVPPRQVKPLHEQGVYRPSPALRSNFERAGALYDRPFVTPQGVGNHREFAFGHDRARLTR